MFSPQIVNFYGNDYLFHNYRDRRGISRWKTEAACKLCGRIHWCKKESFYANKVKMCKDCAIQRLKNKGKDHLGYINGRVKRKSGYINVLLDPNDQYISMANSNRYVAEHRLVLAKNIQRPLKSCEHVHHLNGKKDDNRLENLMLLDGGIHNIVTKLEQKIKRLEQEIKELKS